jgi:hypothetical protein
MSETFEGGDFTSPYRSPYTPDLYPVSNNTNYNHTNTRKDYHDFIDDNCVIPSTNHDNPHNLTTLYKDDDDSCDDDSGFKSVKTRAFIAGLIAFIYIYLFVWVADKYGPIWAGILGSVPGTLLAAIFFEREERVPSLVFALILGGVAAIAAAAIFYWLTVSTGLDKYTILTVSVIIWVVVIGVLFTLFKEKIESNFH